MSFAFRTLETIDADEPTVMSLPGGGHMATWQVKRAGIGIELIVQVFDRFGKLLETGGATISGMAGRRASCFAA